MINIIFYFFSDTTESESEFPAVDFKPKGNDPSYFKGSHCQCHNCHCGKNVTTVNINIITVIVNITTVISLLIFHALL